MAETTIEWASGRRADGSVIPGYTFNPVIGCSKISPGCQNCYAAVETFTRVQRAKGRELWGDAGERHVTSKGNWAKPLAWNKEAEAMGERRKVFCASLSDWLEDRPEWIHPRASLLYLIRQTPWLDWLLLSKRVDGWRARMQEVVDIERVGSHDGHILAHQWLNGLAVPENVQLGVTVENQKWADARREAFKEILARVKFVSYEPALGPVDWAGWEFVDQIISGGESGNNARPSHPNWHRSTRDWCNANGKTYFFKQWGSWKPFS